MKVKARVERQLETLRGRSRRPRGGRWMQVQRPVKKIQRQIKEIAASESLQRAVKAKLQRAVKAKIQRPIKLNIPRTIKVKLS